MKPLVSVVMPAYNGEKYIGEAIESILNQTYTDFELIIIEDKSTDHTLQAIQKYKDSRIHLYTNSYNRGISYSTNLGISQRMAGCPGNTGAAFKSCRQPKILCPPTAEKERIPRHPLHAAPLPYALPGRGHDSLCGCRIPPAPGL